MEVVNDDGTVVSSAQAPGRAGSKNDWVTLVSDWERQPAFLRRVDLPDGVELGLIAVRPVHVGEKKIYIIGGQRLNQGVLSLLAPPPGVRVLLYRNLRAAILPAALLDAQGTAEDAQRFVPLIQEVQNQHDASVRSHQLSESGRGEPAKAETFISVPLTGRTNELLGVLLVGSAASEVAEFSRYVQTLTLALGLAGFAACLLAGSRASARITRPLSRLNAAVRDVAAGKWNAQVQETGSDDVGDLTAAFNDMTRHLGEERDRLLQLERVTAWREMARRLAGELKYPLFPLQITVENMVRAQELTPGQSGENFAESAGLLHSEIGNLRAIAARFSAFAKMPVPRLQPLSVNDAVRAALKTLEPSLSEIGRPPVMPESYLDEGIARIQADPEWFQKALEKLLAFSIDAMPAGGVLTLRTSQQLGVVRLEVSDTGAGTRAENGRFIGTNSRRRSTRPGPGHGAGDCERSWRTHVRGIGAGRGHYCAPGVSGEYGARGEQRRSHGPGHGAEAPGI